MAKETKRRKVLADKVKEGNVYSLTEACEVVCSTASTKFDETVDIALHLGVDPRKSDQNVRGSVPLPNGLGKEVRVVVFAKGDKAKEATDAGADRVGAEDLTEDIQGGFMDFDSVVATPDMMAQVGKLGKVLGPRGLMPSPKIGTVTFDVGDAIKSIKAGRAEFRVEKAGIVHAAIGKASFGSQKIEENLAALIGAINKLKPSSSKGFYLKSGVMSLTMGPVVRFDVAPLRSN